MPEPVPLVDAMRRIRTWPWSEDQQSAHIDMLIEAVLIDLYPSPEWIISVDHDSRTIHVAHWKRIVSGETEMWSYIPGSVRDISCVELESAGEGWLALAQSQMP